MIRIFLALTFALSTLVVTSCKRSAGTPPDSTTAAAQGTHQRVFQVKGIVKAVNLDRNQIEIKHEAIPDYMPAMTMPFDVRDTNELSGLSSQQPIAFRLTVTDTDGWVDNIKALGPPPEPTTTNTVTAPTIHVVVQPLKAGDPLPEYHLTNEMGQAITTAQYKGQALAITFLFTRCPFPTFCPRLANDFTETQEKMLSLPGGPTNWHLLTISFDPEFDSPAVLKAYAVAHRYDPSHSTFATGNTKDITSLGDRFGLAFWQEGGSITHNMRTAIIDANGRLQVVFEGNNWTGVDLAAEMVKAANP